MAALLLDIANFLISSELATADGTDIFRDFIPEEPDTLVALLEYTGSTNQHDDAALRSVQVLCRNLDADIARQKALSIFQTIKANQDESGKVTLTENRWGQVALRQSPFKLKTDENNRVYYVFNMGITTSIE